MSVHSSIELEFGNVGLWGEGKTGVPGEKTSRSRVENQQQIQPTYDVRESNRAHIGGRCSHNCAISAPLIHTVFVGLINFAALKAPVGTALFSKINRTAGDNFWTFFFLCTHFYKNIWFYKNIDAEVYEIVRIHLRLKFWKVYMTNFYPQNKSVNWLKEIK